MKVKKFFSLMETSEFRKEDVKEGLYYIPYVDVDLVKLALNKIDTNEKIKEDFLHDFVENWLDPTNNPTNRISENNLKIFLVIRIPRQDYTMTTSLNLSWENCWIYYFADNFKKKELRKELEIEYGFMCKDIILEPWEIDSIKYKL